MYLPTVASRRGHPHPRKETNDTDSSRYRERSVGRPGDRSPHGRESPRTDSYVTVPKLHPRPGSSEADRIRPRGRATPGRATTDRAPKPAGRRRRRRPGRGRTGRRWPGDSRHSRRRCVPVSSPPRCQSHSSTTDNAGEHDRRSTNHDGTHASPSARPTEQRQQAPPNLHAYRHTRPNERPHRTRL